MKLDLGSDLGDPVTLPMRALESLPLSLRATFMSTGFFRIAWELQAALRDA